MMALQRGSAMNASGQTADGTGVAGLRWRIAPTWFWALAALSTVLFVAFVMQLPVAILAGAGHDDAWFWRRAQSIATGHWLGGYDQSTLMKGAGYPLFLAVNHLAGLSLPLSQSLLYGAACVALALAVVRSGARHGWALLLLVCLQWHPMAFEWQRIIRDNIYAAQTLLVLACLSWWLFVARSRRGRLAGAAMAGLLLGWFWSTREDGIWIAPGIGILLLAGALRTAGTRSALRQLVGGAALMALACGCVLTLIAAANWAKYGRFETVDLKGAAFTGAVSSLQRVRVGDAVAHVPVPEQVRRAVYPLSPAFARLQPYLEDERTFWRRPGCQTYPDTCGDYAGGWFIWALRDGVTTM